MCQAAGCLLLETLHFSFLAASLIPLLHPLVTSGIPSCTNPPRGARNIKMRDTTIPWCQGKSRETFISQLGRCPLGCPIEEESGAGSHPPPSAGQSYTAPCSLELTLYWECWH